MAVFELGGALASELRELTIGPWASAPLELAAFDAALDPAFDAALGPALGPPESLWRVALARDDAANRAALAEGEQSIARAHAALDDLPRRLERALAEPAREPGPAPTAPGRLERALLHAGDLARGRARIETRIAGVIVARSITALSGDTELWISPGLSSEGAGLHARSVAIALRTRHAWARILAMAVTWCGRLAALGGPAAGVAALPILWGFLRDVLREVRDREPC